MSTAPKVSKAEERRKKLIAKIEKLETQLQTEKYEKRAMSLKRQKYPNQDKNLKSLIKSYKKIKTSPITPDGYYKNKAEDIIGSSKLKKKIEYHVTIPSKNNEKFIIYKQKHFLTDGSINHPFHNNVKVKQGEYVNKNFDLGYIHNVRYYYDLDHVWGANIWGPEKKELSYKLGKLYHVPATALDYNAVSENDTDYYCIKHSKTCIHKEGVKERKKKKEQLVALKNKEREDKAKQKAEDLLAAQKNKKVEKGTTTNVAENFDFGSSNVNNEPPTKMLRKGTIVKFNNPGDYFGARYARIRHVYMLSTPSGITWEGIVRTSDGNGFTTIEKQKEGVKRLGNKFHNDAWIVAKMIAKEKFELSKVPVEFTTAYVKRYIYSKDFIEYIEEITKPIDKNRTKNLYYKDLLSIVKENTENFSGYPIITKEDIKEAGGYYDPFEHRNETANEYYKDLINKILDTKKSTRNPQSVGVYTITKSQIKTPQKPAVKSTKKSVAIQKLPETTIKKISELVANTFFITKENVTKNDIKNFIEKHNIHFMTRNAITNLKIKEPLNYTKINTIVENVVETLNENLQKEKNEILGSPYNEYNIESFGRRRKSMFKKSFRRRH